MTTSKWQKVETSPTWDFVEEPELIGFYVGAETDVGPNHSNLYTFHKEDSSVISVWGNTVLDNRFKHLVKDEMVKIVYKGKTESPKTGRAYHDFDVFKKPVEPLEKVEEQSDEEVPPPSEIGF